MDYFEGNNIGGIASLEVILAQNVTNINPVQLSGGNWTKIPFKDQSGQYKEATEETVNGTIYTYSGSFMIPCLRDEVNEIMDAFLGRRSMIRIIDMNLRALIIGAPGMPVELTSTGTTSQNYAGENAATYEFKVTQHFRAVKG